VVSSGRGREFMLASAMIPAARRATDVDRRPLGALTIEIVMEH